MANHFSSALELFENAKARIDDLDRALREFSESGPYTSSIGVHAHTGYRCAKIHLNKPVPQAAKFAARDAFRDPRAALDHAGYACTIRSARSVRKGGFPFAKTKEQFKGFESGVSKDIPREILDLMMAYRGYGDEDGDTLLYALNKVGNINEHRFLVPFGVVSLTSKSSMQLQITKEKMELLRDDGGRKFLLNPQLNLFPTIDPDTNEMELAIWDDHLYETVNFDVNIHVALGEAGALQFLHPTAVLRLIAPKVEGILSDIEKEANRIGLFDASP